ncbi:hypothetical protein PIROE2DRAFT_13788 [Piromyces sp. E2]|nr:hypothetical protein PIROE2DRAFT_13788 [Piromyces sp. E2]|eukprot:OUM60439.1 hypothetical protein PIROE2DRAFT_13788 [Piromyces sp. E2]
MLAINPLRSSRLSAAHARNIRNYDIGGDDSEALCMLSHVLITRIETRSSSIYGNSFNHYSKLRIRTITNNSLYHSNTHKDK